MTISKQTIAVEVQALKEVEEAAMHKYTRSNIVL